MREALGWSYAAAGALSAANTLGYLLGATVAGTVLARVGPRRAFRVALLTTVLGLAATGAARGTVALVALRLLVGVSGALVFVAGATLAAHVAVSSGGRSARSLGMYFGGVGFGIAASGALIPFLVPVSAAQRWPVAWWAMAGLALVGATVAFLAAGTVSGVEPSARRGLPAGLRPLAFALLGYVFYGLGYIGYMTFLVAFLQQAGRGAGAIAATWVLLGLAATTTGLVWERPLAALSAGRGLALVLAVLAAGAALPLVSRNVSVIALSGVLFGGSFLGVISSITRLIREMLPPNEWARTIAAATMLFAAGQAAGPLLTGWVADALGGLGASLGASLAFLACAIVLASFQRDPSGTGPPRA